MTQDPTLYAATDRLPRLLTAGDVAKVLNISRSYAYKLIRDGTIPSIQIGRSVRIRYMDLMEFIDEKVHINQV